MVILFMGLKYPNWMLKQLNQVYDVVNIQTIWDSSNSEEEKEKKYRKAIENADVLLNYHTGLFFWAKASYAKLKKKKVVTIWDGDDLYKALTYQNGFLGHQMIDLHIATSKEVKDGLDDLGIDSQWLDFDNTKDKLWIREFQKIMK